MATCADQITAMARDDDPYDYSPRELLPLQLEAARERLAERVGQIKVLEQRASNQGTDAIRSADSLVPLLFSHTTYKSYPESFLVSGNWTMLTRWLDTLNTAPALGKVDLDAVQDVDDWISRLHEVEHLVGTSSGTTGQSSFFDQFPVDREFRLQWLRQTPQWTAGLRIENWPVFGLGPRHNRTSSGDWQRLRVAAYGRPDAIYFLTDEVMTVAELNQQSVLRRELAQGIATPSQIATLQEDARRRHSQASDDMARLIDNMLAHREEPVVVSSLYVQLFDLVETAKARGLGQGELLHPESFIYTGGGTKRVGLPGDFKHQMQTYFGLNPGHFGSGYGMYELTTPFPKCRAARYHVPPWIIPIIVDETGERLLVPDNGQVTGRGAFFDIALEARWGGVISGDRLTVDYNQCGCGRMSPAVLDKIDRYADLPGGDDKLSCAGTIEDYIHGIVGVDA